MASELLSYAEFARTVGFPGLIFLIWYLFWRGEKQKWELQLDQQKALRVIQKEKEDADRKEHQHKWNSMVQSYTDQIRQLIENFNKQQEQQFRLMNRQAEAIELSAELLNKLSAKIDAFMMMKEKQDGRISTNEG
jgi:hypothetical protein